MKLTDLHYAAGYLEGEGCFYVRSKPGNHGLSMQIQVQATDKEPLEKLKQFFGGTLRGPYAPRGTQLKPTFAWSLGRNAGCIKIMQQIFPLMSPRRQKKLTEIFQLDKKFPLDYYLQRNRTKTGQFLPMSKRLKFHRNKNHNNQTKET